ncbi:alpha/beta hydrolase family protein [Phytohabitans kaempferiae]|uniref:Alpha/beta fold hydrolase n=1 Tax=Phytohabitans kaempferiae TaxID=1620943 RepID=A0ABV6MGK0_9ACTN
MPTEDYAQEYLDRGTDRLGLQVYPEPDGVADPPVVVVWPAMGVRARYYRPLAASLRRAGMAVVVADLRGTGASTPPSSRSSGYGYAELADDVGAVQEALKPRLDGRRRIVLGHSLGGQAALLHLALAGQSDVDGVVLMAVGLPYWRVYPRRRLGVLAMTQAIGVTSAALRVWPGWGFGGRQARGVIRDWAHTARTGRFPRLGGVDAEAALGALRTPVLAISVDHDQYTPHETLDHLCGKLRAAEVTRERHAIAGADHFTWVRAADPVADRIAAWTQTLL